MKKTIEEIIRETVKVIEGLSLSSSAAIEKAATAIIESLKGGGKSHPQDIQSGRSPARE